MTSRTFVLAVLMVGSPQLAWAQSPRMMIRVDNGTAVARESETVSLPWRSIVSRLAGVSSSRVRVRDVISGKEVAAQALDADADGTPDSLLFQVNLAAGDARTFFIDAAPPTKPEARVHAKFVPEREDVAWESDRIAFRLYGKKLWELENLHTNGIDVWPKRTRALVLDAWYAKGHDGYHIDTGEGADFYQVGNTLGTGGVGVWRHHTLFRGDNFLAHRIIADGPVRAIFELEYGAINAQGVRATERKRVSIDAGQHFFRQESTFSVEGGAALEVAVGLVKRAGMVGSSSKERAWAWLTGWGPIEQRTRGHGDLGTAVLINKSQLVEILEIDNHYIAIGRIEAGGTLVSYVGAGWTSSRDFKSAEDWWRHVDTLAERLGQPLQVRIVTTEAADAR